MGDVATKKVKKFSWHQVPLHVTRELLLAVYRADKEDAALEQLHKLDDRALARQAEEVFGLSGIAKGHWDVATPVLRGTWLPTVAARELLTIARVIQLELSGQARKEPLETKDDALKFLNRRNATDTFKKNLMALFARLHKEERTVEVKVAQPPEVSGPAISTMLVGRNASDPRKPYPHQKSAWNKLDEMQASGGRRAGLLVLPTGAGKTYTMVAWLVRELAKHPDLRVLWIADQQELVEQAARVFLELGPMMPAGTQKHIRVLHGAADSIHHLGAASLDIACVTRQSLVGAQFNEGAKLRLANYLQRPTVVVIDEAHHAVASQYDQLLDFMEKHTSHSTFVGLTATPWPAGSGMTRKLHDRFDTAVANVEVRTLVKSGILATPVIHMFDTAVNVPITAEEVTRIARQDVPGDVLKKLDQAPRTQMIVRTWMTRREDWGKTLVFAPTINNADHLGSAFREAGVQTWVIHSKSEATRSESIHAFREYSGPSVLVSVGMLREGVDLPDAKTAFLARPTTSRILMRQMIGRVLRGPSAGGDTYANVVDLRDRWGADVDILKASELADIEGVLGDPTTPELRLPPILDEVTRKPISEHILGKIAGAYAELWSLTFPHAGALHSTRLLGFYDLGDVNVPVFEHCQDAWRELIQVALGSAKASGASLSLFDECPVPRPAERDARDVVSFCRSHQIEPPLVPVQVTFSVKEVAREVLNLPAMTEGERQAWLHDKWASSLARAAFPTPQGFVEEVSREVFEIASGLTRNDPEAWPPLASEGLRNQPKLEEADRELAPHFKATVAEGRTLLAGEPEYRSRLAIGELPRYEWTRTRPRGTWAYWAPRISGKNRSEPIIRVNRILKTNPAIIPDRLIETLIWHELCHHLLPGRGHDAEFRRLEALWPGMVEYNALLDGLHEEFDLMPNPARSAVPGPQTKGPSVK